MLEDWETGLQCQLRNLDILCLFVRVPGRRTEANSPRTNWGMVVRDTPFR